MKDDQEFFVPFPEGKMTIPKISKNLWKEANDLPIIPALPKDYDSSVPLPNKPIAKCGECGREIYAMEMYSCMNNRCPVQPKIVC